MYHCYHNKLVSTCQEFKIEVPFTRAEFVKDCEDKGFFGIFAMLMFGYDPVVVEPNMFERVIWILEKAVKYNPSLFDSPKNQ